MNKPKIKVCGVTTLENALAIEEVGVDYIGFNFIPSSKRYIAPSKALNIISKLKKAVPVGVFMNQDLNYIQKCIDESGITMVQLHGNESPELCSSLTLPVIKVFSIDSSFNPEIISEYDPHYFLFDAKVGNELGGTGHTFDWRILDALCTDRPYFLAGGLGPTNISEAINNTSAFALDLNSKIEIQPGLKNIDALIQCMSQVSNT